MIPIKKKIVYIRLSLRK